MKQRILSGIVIALITITACYFGGYYYFAVVTFITFWATYEFTKLRDGRINKVEYLLMILYVFTISFFRTYDIAWTIILTICCITIPVFDERVTLVDAAMTVAESILLAFSIYELVEIEMLSKWMLAYIIIIAYLTDVFAYFVGRKFGKHKLNERVSPKKTIEGAIGGWIIGCIVSIGWAAIFNFFYMDVTLIVICSIVLPIVSQIGDLVFSLIKRYYGIKDFSNLIPGHGGLLDRLDSLMFVLFIFGAIFEFFR